MSVGEFEARTKHRVIGKALPRHDARDKVQAQTRYAGDFTMPNMLHGAILRSDRPSARIARLDCTAARALDGVWAVLTAADVPNLRLPVELPGQTGKARNADADAPILSDGRIRYQGEAIALVAAETAELAQFALSVIDIEYEDLPGVFDPLEAMQPGAPKLAGDTNVIAQYHLEKGDLAEGFAQADLVVEGSYRTQLIDHAYLEPESGVAWLDDDGVITIRTATQVIEHFRTIARMLDLPHSKVRIIGTMVGGGFGGREDMTIEAYLALLTWKTRRPVRIHVTREESFLTHGKRHPFVLVYRTGVRRDGTITALEARVVSDAGAYAYLSPFVLIYGLITAAGPYRIPNVRVDASAVLTNNPFTSAMRGFGALQTCFAYEVHLDRIAAEVGIHPLELRRLNVVHRGDSIANGQIVEHEPHLDEMLTRAWEALPSSRQPRPGRRIGRGIAACFGPYGRVTWTHDTSSAYVGIEPDGSVIVRSGVPDVGGGQASSLASITSEVLGVPPERISVYITDSALTPLSGTTTATRQLYMSGNAVLSAAREVRMNLLRQAAEMLETSADRLDLADEFAFDTHELTLRVPLARVVAACAQAGVPRSSLATFKADFTDLPDPETWQGKAFNDFTYGAQAVEVEVDEETGEVIALTNAACFDVGQAINRQSVEGQIQGGVVMGLGQGLIEDFVVERGVVKTPSLSEYLLPTAVDAPEIITMLLETGNGVGPFGAKGIGEPPTLATAPALSNAVFDAVGARVTALPITPEKVVRALGRLPD
ncbi:MAG: xanthine dehydrogenase family protein molybdopterin-binding subunit [Chloroflexi bacterium]|nr:xanthine dehydrogenase family protein molybdopterin-binding subunit [Chloroflexota bacterium]